MENADEHLTLAKLILCYTVITLRPGVVRVSTLGANKQHRHHHVIMDGMYYNEKKWSLFIDDREARRTEIRPMTPETGGMHRGAFKLRKHERERYKGNYGYVSEAREVDS